MSKIALIRDYLIQLHQARNNPNEKRQIINKINYLIRGIEREELTQQEKVVLNEEVARTIPVLENFALLDSVTAADNSDILELIALMKRTVKD